MMHFYYTVTARKRKKTLYELKRKTRLLPKLLNLTYDRSSKYKTKLKRHKQSFKKAFLKLLQYYMLSQIKGFHTGTQKLSSTHLSEVENFRNCQINYLPNSHSQTVM